VPIQSVRLR
jgi:hypothetical protein